MMSFSLRRLLSAPPLVALLTLLGTGMLIALSPPPTITEAIRSAVVTLPTVRDSTVIGSLPAGLRLAPQISSDLPRPLPSNAWWSGGVLDAFPAPLFAWPLVTTFAENGVSIDAPGQTTLPNAVPVALSPEFATLKAATWTSFLRRNALAAVEMTATLEAIRAFTWPVLEAATTGASFALAWTPASGWQAAKPNS